MINKNKLNNNSNNINRISYNKKVMDSANHSKQNNIHTFTPDMKPFKRVENVNNIKVKAPQFLDKNNFENKTLVSNGPISINDSKPIYKRINEIDNIMNDSKPKIFFPPILINDKEEVEEGYNRCLRCGYKIRKDYKSCFICGNTMS